MNITVVGTGYVGLSLSVLLAQKNKVVAVDINSNVVDLINKKISPITDEYISEYLSSKDLDLLASTPNDKVYESSEIVIISTPTDYNPATNQFDTSSVTSVLDTVYKLKKDALVVIKSTIPIGFTEEMKLKYPGMDIVFSPEFLREGKALFDNLNPSRIIIGNSENKLARAFAEELKTLSLNDPVVLEMNNTEAEAVKLFSNTYLAMRVSYFNELDSYAETHSLNSKDIIKGVSLDNRIGDYYNNPSFGYGGYCLPKDTQQLLYNFEGVPQNIISAIVDSNKTRKNYITKSILDKDIKTVGVYRLIMKTGSDNFRDSAIFDIINNLKLEGIEVYIYEPSLNEFQDFELISDIEVFAEKSDIIITNRLDDEIIKYNDKLYTRDIFTRD